MSFLRFLKPKKKLWERGLIPRHIISLSFSINKQGNPADAIIVLNTPFFHSRGELFQARILNSFPKWKATFVGI
jgi:hypothetical protein